MQGTTHACMEGAKPKCVHDCDIALRMQWELRKATLGIELYSLQTRKHIRETHMRGHMHANLRTYARALTSY